MELMEEPSCLTEDQLESLTLLREWMIKTIDDLRTSSDGPEDCAWITSLFLIESVYVICADFDFDVEDILNVAKDVRLRMSERAPTEIN